MTARLAAGIWVAAYLRRLQIEGIPAYVIARGDETAGAVLVKIALLDGRARAHMRMIDLANGNQVWQVLINGAESDVDAAIARQRGYDPDLWVIEVEDARGRDFLDDLA